MTIYALVDCNNFYASCERLFAPKLEGKPVIVLSNNDGCVIARSNEAKAIGIEMGVPVHQCMHLVYTHQVTTFSANFALYGDLSARVMATLAELTSEIEIYSIDEAFLDLSGFEQYGCTDYARQIRATVKKWTGIPVSIGLGATKTLAKVANRIAKNSPDASGVFNLAGNTDLEQILAQVDVADVWGIGRKSAHRLRVHCINNALQLRDANEWWVKQELGVLGLRIVLELRGISCLPLELCPAPTKGRTVSRSFGHAVTSLVELKEAIATYTSRAAAKLRHDEQAAKVLSVFLITNKFNKSEPQYFNSTTCELPVATNDTAELIGYASMAISSLYREGYRYKKTGITLTELVPSRLFQTSLFDHKDRERSRKVMQVIDQINQQWGAGTIFYAAAGLRSSWRGKSDSRSPRYTTCWQEIPLVKT